MTKSYVESIQRPKRARSAYNFFFRSERAKLLGVTENELCIRDQQKRKHRKTPGMIGFAKLAAYIGEKWKSMSEDEKLPFRLKSQLEKEKFNRKFVSSGVESSRYLSSNKMLFLQEGTHFKCIDEYQQTDAARLFYQSKMKKHISEALSPQLIDVSQSERVSNCSINSHVTIDLEPTPIENMVETSFKKKFSDLSCFLEICDREDWLICLAGCYTKDDINVRTEENLS